MVDRVDDLAGVDALQVDAGDPKMCMLDMRVIWQRDPFVGHFDRVRVPELMQREPPPHIGLRGEPAKLAACRGR